LHVIPCRRRGCLLVIVLSETIARGAAWTSRPRAVLTDGPAGQPAGLLARSRTPTASISARLPGPPSRRSRCLLARDTLGGRYVDATGSRRTINGRARTGDRWGRLYR
jgi:hypothetical protein